MLSEEAFLSWGWRVAFLISAVLVAFGLWIRLTLEGTPVFLAMKEAGERPKAPVREVFATQRRALVAAALARVGPDVLYSLFTALGVMTVPPPVPDGGTCRSARSRFAAGRLRYGCPQQRAGAGTAPAVQRFS